MKHRPIDLVADERDWIGRDEFCEHFDALCTMSASVISITTYTHVPDMAQAGQGIAHGWHHAVRHRIKT